MAHNCGYHEMCAGRERKIQYDVSFCLAPQNGELSSSVPVTPDLLTTRPGQPTRKRAKNRATIKFEGRLNKHWGTEIILTCTVSGPTLRGPDRKPVLELKDRNDNCIEVKIHNGRVSDKPSKNW